MTVAIETSDLVKTFGPTRAVDGVDLAIPKGTIYGLLGPNGAGKTTTIRVLSTLLKPTAGTATVLGHDVVEEAAEVRRKIGLTGQVTSIDEELTGRENLVLVGRLLGMTWDRSRGRAGELLPAFGLDHAADRQVRTYSGGERRRLDIAASLVVDRDVLFLDEPTTGLDPRSRSQVWQLIRAIAAAGTTVLLTTQYMEEADRLADRMAVIDHGRVIAEGTGRELKASVGANRLHVRVRRPGQRGDAAAVLAKALGAGVAGVAGAPDVVLSEADPTELSATVAGEEAATEVLAVLRASGVPVAEFSLGSPSLDEVFLALTGRPARDQDADDGEGAEGPAPPGGGEAP